MPGPDIGIREDQWPKEEQDKDLLELGWSAKLSSELVPSEPGHDRYEWIYDHPVSNYLNGWQGRAMARHLAELPPRIVLDSDLDKMGRVFARRKIHFTMQSTPKGFILNVGAGEFLFNHDGDLTTVIR
jgi:hypothetical protein